MHSRSLLRTKRQRRYPASRSNSHRLDKLQGEARQRTTWVGVDAPESSSPSDIDGVMTPSVRLRRLFRVGFFASAWLPLQLIGQDLVSGGDNFWILHTPDDARTSLYIAPGVNGSPGTYNWGAQTELREDGAINFSGNIGIGTTGSPATRLMVKGPFTPSYMQLSLQATGADDRTGLSFLNGAGSRIASFYAAADGHAYFSGTELPGGVFHLYSAGAERMTILPNGNIGVGTSIPSYKLDVQGGYITASYDSSTVRAFMEGSTGVSYFGNLGHGDIAIGNSHNWGYVFVKDGGNVGIGTNHPTHRLSVNGSVKAKEVIVETTGWSDYVFAEGYELPSLEEVEAHIREHKHLPGVPPAKNVMEQGVSIGEMQATLLAKIEELTLHVIRQEKSVAAARSLIESQQREIEALKGQLSQFSSSR